MQCWKYTCLPRASGSSCLPWYIEMSLQRTKLFCSAKSEVSVWSAPSWRPNRESALKPGALMPSRYSPAGRFSIV